MDLRQLIFEYLEKTRMMQVATANDNQPWVCTVYFAYDEHLNLYWISQPSRRHSIEIRANEKVAGVIALPHTPGDDVRGIQFQGTAIELNTRSIAESGLRCYGKRYGMDEEKIEAILSGKNGHVCYQIKPTIYVLFDEVNFPDDPRQEYSL